MDFKKEITKELLIDAGLIIAFTVMTLFVINDISTTQASITKARTERTENLKIKNNLEELVKEEKIADNYFSPLKNALPQKNELFVFQNEIRQIASSQGLTADLRFIGEEEGGSVGKASFNLEVYGDYNRIMTFIKDLESSRYFINFGNFEINTQSGTSYQAKISGKVFYK